MEEEGINLRKKMQDDAIEMAMSQRYCTIVLPFRVGKTYIGLKIAEKYEKVLVSYPNRAILESWKNDAEKFGMDIENITFTTHISLHNYKLDEYDIVILDEIQAVSEAVWVYISTHKPKRMKGLTATPPIMGIKNDFMNQYCPIRYKVELESTVGIINKDYKITVHMLEPSDRRDIVLSKGRMWSERSKISFWDKKYRDDKKFMTLLKVIQTIQNSETKMTYAMKLAESLDRVLIFVETIEQCSKFNYPSYHSKNKDSESNLEDFKSGKINKLVTVKQLSQGITVPVNNIIILHCYSSNDKASQRLARALNYVQDEIANINILGLSNTREEKWIASGIEQFDKSKVFYNII